MERKAVTTILSKYQYYPDLIFQKTILLFVSFSKSCFQEPTIFQIRPQYKQREDEDVKALSAKAGKIGKIGNMLSNPQVEQRTFCSVNVATKCPEVGQKWRFVSYCSKGFIC